MAESTVSHRGRSSSRLQIGILGLDTSHAETFADALSESDDATVTAVWDGGAVREAPYVGGFCEEYGAVSYDDPSSMIDEVDAAMILTVDWDTHLDLARPFLEAGVPTFVDKVVAGSVADVEAMADAAGDTPLFGGSSIPFHPAVEEFPKAISNRTLYAAGYNNPFYYGAHIVDSTRAVAGAPWTLVRPLDGSGIRVEVSFENETQSVLQFDGETDEPAFGFLDVADHTRTARIAIGDGYEAMRESFFEAFLAAASGERTYQDRILDAATLQLAVHAALDAGETITPGAQTLREYNADGEAYASVYANDQPAAITDDY